MMPLKMDLNCISWESFHWLVVATVHEGAFSPRDALLSTC